MKHTQPLWFRGIAASAIVFAATPWGCSSSSSTGTGGKGPDGSTTSGGGATSGTGGAVGGASTGGAATGAGGAGSADCSSQARDACLSCCGQKNASGKTKYDAAIKAKCACTPGATCDEPCSDFICIPDAGTTPAGCTTCVTTLKPTDTCVTAAAAACTDAACTSVMNCVSACPAQ